MTAKIIIGLIVAIVAVGAITVYFFYSSPSAFQPTLSVSPSPTPTATPPLEVEVLEVTPVPATGNIDDAVNTLLLEITDEQILLDEVEGDAALVSDDSQEIGNFGQSIDEKEL